MAQQNKNSIIWRKGEKVILRPRSAEDIPAYTRWLNDPEVTQYVSMRYPLSLEEERELFERKRVTNDEVLVAVATIGGKLIGCMGLHRIDRDNRTAWTGAIIGEKTFWNKGYGTEAKILLLDFAFHEMNLQKICSAAYVFNERSIAYSKKCGYREEGRHRRMIYKHGEYHDIVLLGLLREEFEPIWEQYLQTRDKRKRR